MLGVRLSTQTIHGMGDGSELGKIEDSLLGTKLGSLEGCTDGTTDTDGNLEGLLLGAWLGSVDGFKLGTNVGNVMVLQMET